MDSNTAGVLALLIVIGLPATVMGGVAIVRMLIDHIEFGRRWHPRKERWGFKKRHEEAQIAWDLYGKVLSDPPRVPPALFDAGFTMGVSAAQKSSK